MVAICISFVLQTSFLTDEQTAAARVEELFGKGTVQFEGKGNARQVRGVVFNFKDIPDEADLRLLAEFEALQKLQFSFSSVSGDFLKHLSSLKNVKVVSLCNARRFQEKNLIHLRQMTTLEELSLTDCNVSDAGVQHIANLPRLRILDLGSTKVTNEAVKLLGTFPSLEFVNLIGTKVDDSGLKSIAKCRKLKAIWLGFTSRITDAGLKQLRPIAANLEEIVLASADGVTDAGLEEIQAMSALRVLELDYLPISDEGLRYLKGLRNLRKLSLRKSKITKQGLACLSEIKNLEHLDLRQTDICDKDVDILSRINGLKFLDVTQTKISDAGIEQIYKRFPKIELLY